MNCDKSLDKIKIHILYSIIIFQKSCPYEVMGKKYGKAKQATSDN
jgi:hypothetical protein